MTLHAQDPVPGAEPFFHHHGARLHPVGGAGQRQVIATPHPQDADVDEHAQQQVHRDPADHDDQALPRGLAAELPRLGRLGQLVLVHAFVDHAADLHIPAEGDPADAEDGIADLLLPQGEAGVEEEEELLHAGAEEPGRDEVPQLVEHHQDAQAQDQLRGLDQEFHAVGMRSYARRRVSLSVASRASRSGDATCGTRSIRSAIRSLISRKPIRS